MKTQPAKSAPFALPAPRCMASLAQLITHVHQSRFKIKNHSMKSKLARLH
jgi:hypothetical protein